MTGVRKAWAKPIFRWAGSKRKLLPLLIEYAPRCFKRYIEPFAGSACLFFALRPRLAVLNDINQDLIATYATLRKHPRLVARYASGISRSKRAYYSVRDSMHILSDPIERAGSFVYLNRNCFNGVYRVNRNGQFNVPRGRRTGTLPNEDLFYRSAIALRNAKLSCGDFEKCLDDVRQGDFLYLDPPYPTARRNAYGEYGYGSFGPCDLPRLLRVLKHADKQGASFALSYADVPELEALPKKWRKTRLNVRRHVAGFAAARCEVPEVIVTNQ